MALSENECDTPGLEPYRKVQKTRYKPYFKLHTFLAVFLSKLFASRFSSIWKK